MHGVFRQLRPLLSHCRHSTFYCTEATPNSRLGTTVADAFAAAPQQAAESISRALTQEQRVALLHALAAAGQEEDGKGLNDAYVRQIFQNADTAFPRGVLEMYALVQLCVPHLLKNCVNLSYAYEQRHSFDHVARV
jgi:hypothetical protein